MNDAIARSRLAAAPADVRDRMLAAREDLPPGAISAVGRFFDRLVSRGEHPSAPSRTVFEEAGASESTLALLLRMLERHAPAVCLAEGRELRRAYYRQRQGGSACAAGVGSGRPESEPSGTQARNWPAAWLALLPGLRAAPIKDSSIDRHVASVNRCATFLPGLVCPPRLGWLLAWELGQAVQRDGSSVRTAEAYIGGLVGLGLHGGLDREALDGLRSVQAYLQRSGRRTAKRKQSRIEALYERGGYAEIVRVIIRELDQADGMADWTAGTARARATAAILAVVLNVPARTGDTAAWTLDEELVRKTWGEWQLRWRQEKTGVWQDLGTLWPEICEVLDQHILGGRPRRHAARRYDELRGCNWLSLAWKGYAPRWPSERVSEALGVPLHDLRTLAADYLRLHNPIAAPDIVAALLGHSTKQAGEAYRALCTETAAQRDWQKIRAQYME